MVASAQGQDRSNFQPVTSWKGLDFGFAKATEGLSFIDPTFTANWRNLATDLEVRGAYHFVHPSESGVAQADFFLRVVEAQGLKNGDVLIADSEIMAGLFRQRVQKPADIPRQALPVKVPRRAATINNATLDFCNRLHQKHPHCPILVYTNLSVGRTLQSCTHFPLFIAFPSSAAPSNVSPWAKWTFWQYGISGAVDLDAFNGTHADMKRWRDSYLPATPTPPVPDPAPTPTPEEDEEMQLNTGTDAVTTFSFTGGTKSEINFAADPGYVKAPTVVLRVAVYSNSKGWSQVLQTVKIVGGNSQSKVNIKFTEKDASAITIARVAGNSADLVAVGANWS